MDERRIKIYFGVCIVLLAIAAVAPLAAGTLFLSMKPEADSLAEWIERSGAITTVFSLLVVSVSSEGLKGLWIPGQMADLDKIEILNKFKPRFAWCENIALVLTIIGTVIWGYGSALF